MIPRPSSASRSAELARLAAACRGRLSGDGTVRVNDVTHDSRTVSPGALFVAVPGEHHDGIRFVPEALEAGAVAVAAQSPGPGSQEIPWILVEDARNALADLAWELWDHPDRELVVIGVTGSNGKSSTAWILERALASLDCETALLGTIAYRFGGHEEPASRTTPEAPEIARRLREAADAEAWGAVMEVSSHALVLRRTRGLTVKAAVFTNLEAEHLDFHGDLESYFQAKSRLFRENLASDGLAVCNADDPRGLEMAKLARARQTVLFGHGAQADLRIQSLETDLEGLRLRLGGLARLEIESPLLGATSALNLTAAAAALLGLGFDPDEVSQALGEVRSVPGRMQSIRHGQEFAVLVDYAHTPDALERLLRTVRGFTDGRVLLVFGCGGDRDPGKRAPMGSVAGRLADLVVLTDDNPRSEDSASIRAAVREGLDPTGVEMVEEPDRERALALAVERARSGDVVVAAGKGVEDYQEIDGVRHPHSDRSVLQELLRRRSGGGPS